MPKERRMATEWQASHQRHPVHLTRAVRGNDPELSTQRSVLSARCPGVCDGGGSGAGAGRVCIFPVGLRSQTRKADAHTELEGSAGEQVLCASVRLTSEHAACLVT